MKKIFLFIGILFLLFASCKTQRESVYDKRIDSTYVQNDTVFVDTAIVRIYEKTLDTIIYLDTSYAEKYLGKLLEKYGKTLKDTVFITRIINNELICNSDSSKLSNQFSISYAYVNQGRLYHNLLQRDTLLALKLENMIKRINRLTYHYKSYENTRETVVEKKPVGLYIILGVILVICIGLLLVILQDKVKWISSAFKYVKKIFKK